MDQEKPLPCDPFLEILVYHDDAEDQFVRRVFEMRGGVQQELKPDDPRIPEVFNLSPSERRTLSGRAPTLAEWRRTYGGNTGFVKGGETSFTVSLDPWKDADPNQTRVHIATSCVLRYDLFTDEDWHTLERKTDEANAGRIRQGLPPTLRAPTRPQ